MRNGNTVPKYRTAHGPPKRRRAASRSGAPAPIAGERPARSPDLDATFFSTEPDRALGVFAYDDLPVDPAGDPLRVPSPACVLALVELLGGDRKRQARPLRDATCRSFPIWDMGPQVVARIAVADDAALDRIAEGWFAAIRDVEADADTDAYELASLLVEVRAALRDAAHGASLFVLMEERAY